MARQKRQFKMFDGADPKGSAPSLPSGQERAILCARLADEKKAENIVILDLRAYHYVADFFVIASGGNERQRAAIAKDAVEQMKKIGDRPLGVAGERGAPWVLADFGDVVLHVFDPETRLLYDLELLWGDAPKVDWR